jgi:DNA-binding MarR family transcriptional regulator
MHKEQCFSFDGLVLKRQQMMILVFIYENKGVSSVKEIAKFLNVTSGAVTQFTDVLVEQKLVKREESLLDRRSVNIKLTPSVEKDFSNFKKKYLEVASKSFSGLSDKEISQFAKLVEKIKTQD